MVKSLGSSYVKAVTEFDDVNNSLVLDNVSKYYCYLVNSYENMINDSKLFGNNFSTNIIIGDYGHNIGESCFMSIFERQDLIQEWSNVHEKFQQNKRKQNTNIIFDISDIDENKFRLPITIFCF